MGFGESAVNKIVRTLCNKVPSSPTFKKLCLLFRLHFMHGRIEHGSRLEIHDVYDCLKKSSDSPANDIINHIKPKKSSKTKITEDRLKGRKQCLAGGSSACQIGQYSINFRHRNIRA